MLDFISKVNYFIQNANMLKPSHSEIHPWHLHGHDLWVFKGMEKGSLRRRTIEKYCSVFGWTALTFVADDPGVWAFHCQIEPHLHMGMGVVFAEDVERVRCILK